MSKVILSFRFYFCLGFPAGRRTRFGRPWSWRGKINKQRRCARKSAELVLVAIFAAVPLWKGVSVPLWKGVPGIRRLFWVVFFLLAVHLVATTYGMPHQPTAKKIAFADIGIQRSAFPERTPLFTSNTFWSYAPGHACIGNAERAKAEREQINRDQRRSKIGPTMTVQDGRRWNQGTQSVLVGGLECHSGTHFLR